MSLMIGIIAVLKPVKSSFLADFMASLKFFNLEGFVKIYPRPYLPAPARAFIPNNVDVAGIGNPGIKEFKRNTAVPPNFSVFVKKSLALTDFKTSLTSKTSRAKVF